MGGGERSAGGKSSGGERGRAELVEGGSGGRAAGSIVVKVIEGARGLREGGAVSQTP